MKTERLLGLLALALPLAFLQLPIAGLNASLGNVHQQAGFGTPIVNGILNETLWQSPTNICIALANWSTDFPYPPKYNSINGTISIANDNDNLYIGMYVANITASLHLRLAIDDNVTESDPQYGRHRGVVYWRTEQSTYISANQIWEVSGTHFWSTNTYGGSGSQILFPDNPYIQWVWTNRTHASESEYTMEGCFHFRLQPGDPEWLLERGPTYRIYFVLELILADTFYGTYTFPAGSPYGGNTEADITQWFTVTCTYNIRTLPLNLWFILPIIGASALCMAVVLVVRRQKKARQGRRQPAQKPSDS